MSQLDELNAILNNDLSSIEKVSTQRIKNNWMHCPSCRSLTSIK